MAALATTGYEAPEHVLTQTPVGRDPELPLWREDVAVAVWTPVAVKSDCLAPLSVVLT